MIYIYFFLLDLLHDIIHWLQGFLHIDEYPPDANQGFDIPSALISFPDFHSSISFAEDSSLSPILSRLKVVRYILVLSSLTWFNYLLI